MGSKAPPIPPEQRTGRSGAPRKPGMDDARDHGARSDRLAQYAAQAGHRQQDR